MASESTDRQLLFGMLALQNGLVSRPQLVSAFARWTSDKSTSLAELLIADGAIERPACERLQQMVELHLELHGGEPEKSLMALSGTDVDEARIELAGIDDADLQQSMAAIPERDPLATVPPSVGQSTSDGGRFRILRPLPGARGGMGEISVAKDEELGRQVALKQILSDKADHDLYRQKFRVEAEVTGNLEHPGIVPVYGLGAGPDGRPYYAMRLVRGDNLNDKLKQFHQALGAKPDYNSVAFHGLIDRLIDVAQAIRYAHSRGVLHRDLKPGNILIGEYGETLVIDWGLARLPQTQGDDPSATTAPIDAAAPLNIQSGSHVDATQQGQILGSLGYAPPEQVNGRVDLISEQSDVYALGAILHHVLLGRPPVPRPGKNRDAGVMIKDTIEGNFPPTRRENRSIPKALSAICSQALEREPTDRYASVEAFIEELERWKADQPVEAAPDSIGDRVMRLARRYRAAALAISATVVGIGMIAVVALSFVNHARLNESAARTKADELLSRSNYFLANARWDEGRMGEARELLARIPDRHRHFEWHYTRRSFLGSCLDLYGHESRVTGLAISPVGNRVVSVSRDGTLRIWNAKTGEAIQTLTGHTAAVTSVVFSHDGTRLFSGGGDNLLKMWDAESGNLVREIPTGTSHYIRCMALSPNGRRIASSSGHALTVWDTESGGELLRLDGTSRISRLEFSPDGERILTGGNGIKLFNSRTGDEVEKLSGRGVWCVKYSPDGSRIVSGSYDKTLALWEVSTGRKLLTLRGHSSIVACVAFSPDGRAIVSGSYDGTLKIWDLQTGRERRTLTGHSGGVTSVATTHDGGRIVSGSSDGTIKFWSTRPVEQLLTFPGYRITTTCGSFSPDGGRLVTGNDFGGLRVWDAWTGERLLKISGHLDQVSSVAFSPDGERIVSVSVDDTLMVWDAKTGKKLKSLEGHCGRVSSVALSPDRDLVISGSHLKSGDQNKTVIWDAQSGKRLHTLPVTYGSQARVAISPNGGIAAFESNNTVRLWNSRTGKLVQSLTVSSGSIHEIEFSPSGRRIAGGGDQFIKIWDAVTGKELQTFRVHTGGVYDIAFSPDGSRIATAGRAAGTGSDKTVRVWDANTGEELLNFLVHSTAYRCVSFSPDGRRIFSGGFHDVLRIWDAGSGRETRALRGHSSTVSSVAFGPDGQRIYSRDRSGAQFVWKTETCEIIPDAVWKDVPPRTTSPDGRWLIVRQGKDILLVDQHFKHTPAEKAYREAKARLDPYWHAEQSREAEEEEDWFAATFHAAWVMKAKPNDPANYDRLHESYDRLVEDFTDHEPPLEDVLPRIVREMLELPRGGEEEAHE